jgi:hypothetical protein
MEDTLNFSKIKSLNNDVAFVCQDLSPERNLWQAEPRDRKIQNPDDCDLMDTAMPCPPFKPHEISNSLNIPSFLFLRQFEKKSCKLQLKSSSHTDQINCVAAGKINLDKLV